ncbi:3-phosphoshikimate 1-carboxyvinyltransferase [Planococcus halotolerans]|uniref:3-phosphoshikimate 1-carboxyvinyltransferase n=1 Tax=Planococcus halotolerans TaxID=2233542 RepID=A0A365L153_9BACL|nr:3-phosphoshikimate 1-carboxyvinyltransferase [Planococcus halotolerans]RAZ79102.1 3-phosphoshikimate 1-carboxyvinyltransferase [Planococcus halotolerans]
MLPTKLNYEKPSLNGTIQVPGDKSISHRSIMFGAIASGKTTVEGFLLGADCLSTISCFRKLGVEIELDGNQVTINSKGIDGWTEPDAVLDTGNSGTTTRLMLGLLAGTSFHSVAAGDDSIAKRPMKRIVDPLRLMGADIRGRTGGQFTPLAIQGTRLAGINYTLPVASAQVKSAILLAALNADGKTVIEEPVATRDHTEIMLRHFGVDIKRNDNIIEMAGGQTLSARHVKVPGDISSAAFFIAAALVTERSEIRLENVGTNPTRTGILDVIAQMGADYEIQENETAGERSADLLIRSSRLKGIEIGGSLIPRLIDEIPIIALIATQCQGTTVIKDAEELRVKETDRITAVVDELSKMGADITATEDGMVINGPTPLSGADMKTYGDHRLGMMAAIASLAADGSVSIDDPDCIAVSYPGFFEHLNNLIV